MDENIVKKVTSINLTNMPEGMRLSYTYSKFNAQGETLSSNERGSFVILDDMTVQISGEAEAQSVNALDVINALFGLASERLT